MTRNHPDNPLLGPRDEVILAHMKYAKATAWRYRHAAQSTATPIEDLESEALVGLIQAYDKYSDQSADFKTYAISYMRGQIAHYFRDKVEAVSIPRSIQTVARRILAEHLERESAQTVSDELDVSEAIAAEGLCAVNARISAPLERDDSEDSPKWEPSIRDDYTQTYVDSFIDRLKPRQAEITRLLIADCSQTEVAARLNVSRQRVSQAVKQIAETYVRSAA